MKSTVQWVACWSWGTPPTLLYDLGVTRLYGDMIADARSRRAQRQ